MWVLCANHENYELGEGYSVEAYSEDLEKIKAYALSEGQITGDPKNFRIRKTEIGNYLVENLWSPDADPSDDDNWDVWLVIEEGDVPTPPINLDE